MIRIKRSPNNEFSWNVHLCTLDNGKDWYIQPKCIYILKKILCSCYRNICMRKKFSIKIMHTHISFSTHRHTITDEINSINDKIDSTTVWPLCLNKTFKCMVSHFSYMKIRCNTREGVILFWLHVWWQYSYKRIHEHFLWKLIQTDKDGYQISSNKMWPWKKLLPRSTILYFPHVIEIHKS